MLDYSRPVRGSDKMRVGTEPETGKDVIFRRRPKNDEAGEEWLARICARIRHSQPSVTGCRRHRRTLTPQCSFALVALGPSWSGKGS